MHSYKDLIVWQRSMELVTELYQLTNQFPKEELYGLTSQLRRAAVSVPSNIAEGRRKGTKKEFLHYLRIAYGSGSEIETQIEISKRLSKTKQLSFKKVDGLLSEVMKMLNVMIRKMNLKYRS
ncbi:four helix bundle protein [Patescibacteria group bacterium]|nr:four helix bundle protein [Patescibacteria group bacterium]